MICGIPIKQINEHGQVTLREVSFCYSPDELRHIAKFFSHVADEFEKPSDRMFRHLHIDEVIQGWRKYHPNNDIVIVGPEHQREDI